jgi:sporulation protein YlmC with PRC-barrel domain
MESIEFPEELAMRTTLLSAASVFAILAGTALAQDAAAPDTSQGQAPAATAPAPAQPTAPAEKMAKPGTMQSGAQGESGQQSTMPSTGDKSGSMAQQPAEGSATGQQPPASTGGTTAQQPPAESGGTTAQQPPASTGGTTAEQPSSNAGTGKAAGKEMPAAGASESTTQSAEAKQPAGPPVSAKDIIGQKVIGSDGKSLGDVSDAIVDSSSGKIEQLIISSGGFLGIGAKTIALEMSQIQMTPGEGIKATDVTQSEVEKMPEFKVDSATQSLEPKAAAASGTGATPAAPLSGTSSQ